MPDPEHAVALRSRRHARRHAGAAAIGLLLLLLLSLSSDVAREFIDRDAPKAVPLREIQKVRRARHAALSPAVLSALQDETATCMRRGWVPVLSVRPTSRALHGTTEGHLPLPGTQRMHEMRFRMHALERRVLTSKLHGTHVGTFQ